MTRVDKLKISLNFCNVTSVFSFIYINRMNRVEELKISLISVMSPVYFLLFIFVEWLVEQLNNHCCYSYITSVLSDK